MISEENSKSEEGAAIQENAMSYNEQQKIALMSCLEN